MKTPYVLRQVTLLNRHLAVWAFLSRAMWTSLPTRMRRQHVSLFTSVDKDSTGNATIDDFRVLMTFTRIKSTIHSNIVTSLYHYRSIRASPGFSFKGKGWGSEGNLRISRAVRPDVWSLILQQFCKRPYTCVPEQTSEPLHTVDSRMFRRTDHMTSVSLAGAFLREPSVR